MRKVCELKMNANQLKKRGYVKKNGVYRKKTALEKYYDDGVLSIIRDVDGQELYQAGRRLYGDFYHSNFAGITSAFNMENIVDSNLTISLNVLESRDRYFKALSAISKHFLGIVRHVVIEDELIVCREFSSPMLNKNKVYSLKRDLCRGLWDLYDHYLKDYKKNEKSS